MTAPANYSAVIANLQAEGMIQAEPAADLWRRILQARSDQLRRQRRLRFASVLVTATVVCVAFWMGLQLHRSMLPDEEAVDWQARAQVLEVQLAALNHDRSVVTSVTADGVEAELGEVDRRLQAAYEGDGMNAQKYTNELAPLWKHRSELLDALILARRQGVVLTRI